MNKKLFAFLTTGLVMIIIMGTAMTVKSQSRNNVAIDEKYYVSMEADYMNRIRENLREDGYADSGITMTKQYGDKDSRSYRVLIHHDAISRLSPEQKDALKEELSEISFPAQNCTFSYEFLVTDGEEEQMASINP